MTFAGIVSIITALVAIGVYVKTKRIGPTATTLIGGGLILVAKDTSVMQAIATAMGSIIKTFTAAAPNLFGS